MAHILVLRQLPNLKYIFGSFLVDIFCLGLKDTFCNANVKYEKVAQLKNAMHFDWVDIPYEDAKDALEELMDYLTRSIDRLPSAQAYYNLASAYRVEGEVKKAIECFKKVVEINGQEGT